MDIAGTLLDAKKCLSHSNPDEATTDARILLQHILQCNRTFIYTYPEKKLTAQQAEQFAALIKRRSTGEPIAYILGYREFWGLKLAVSPATLIPRPETELLVEAALELVQQSDARVLDLGTGTGAVALSIASEKPHWHVEGIDSVGAAIELAKTNKNSLSIENVTFFVSDWFSAVALKQYSVIVSNPPYVEEDSEYLTKGDLRFEPSSALVSANCGLSDIYKIIDNSPNYLANNGWLMIEHGFKQAQRIATYMLDRGFQLVTVRQDIQQLPRVTIGCWLH
jgi:release factor glutamine methyltransferase